MRLSQGKCLQRIDTVQFHNNCAAVSAEAKFFGIGAATTEVKVKIPEIRTVPPEIRTVPPAVPPLCERAADVLWPTKCHDARLLRVRACACVCVRACVCGVCVSCVRGCT